MNLQPDLQQVLSQAISFLILFAVLKRFAWRPLLAMLDQRRAQIEDGLRQVAQSKDELARLKLDYDARLAKIDEEARGKIQQAVLEGKRIALEVQEQAREQAQAILAKSKDTIAMELSKARVTLRDQVADMTVSTVERILKERLDAPADRKLIDAALDELEQGGARN